LGSQILQFGIFVVGVLFTKYYPDWVKKKYQPKDFSPQKGDTCYLQKEKEDLIKSKMKGEAAKEEVKMPKKPAAKSMMEMLMKTAESLK